MSPLPRSPHEGKQYRRPSAEHLTDYDIRNINDEATLDSLLGLDKTTPQGRESRDVPSAHEMLAEAAADTTTEDSALPDLFDETTDGVGEDTTVRSEDLSMTLQENAPQDTAVPDIPDLDAFDDAISDASVADSAENTDTSSVENDFELPDFSTDEDSLDTSSGVSEEADPFADLELDGGEHDDDALSEDFLQDFLKQNDLWSEPEDETTGDASAMPEDVSFESFDEDNFNSAVQSDDDEPLSADDDDSIMDLSSFLEDEEFSAGSFWDDTDDDNDNETDTEVNIAENALTAEDSSAIDDDLTAMLEDADFDFSDFDSVNEDEENTSSSWADVAGFDDDEDTDSNDESLSIHSFDDMLEDDDSDSSDEDSLPSFDAIDDAEDFDDDDDEYIPEDFDEYAMPALTKENADSFDTDTDDDPVEDALEGEEDHDDDEDDEHEPLRFVMPPILSPLKAVFGVLKTVYMFIVGIFFKVLLFVIGILTALPIIGKLFKPLKSMTKLLERIAMALPLVFVVGLFAIVWWFSVPSAHDIELPDMGAAEVSSFGYDSDTGEVTAHIENTGDIIAEVQVDVSVRTLQPSWNPISWMVPEEAATCSTVESVEIGQTDEITVECATDVDGFFPRVTGELSAR